VGPLDLVKTTKGGTLRFDVVVSCVGMLNVPKYPVWPVLGPSRGRASTPRWEHERDLTGKRVAFVGTASASAQFVPAIAPGVGALHVCQREPGVVLPKNERAYTEAERDKYRTRPYLQRLTTARLLLRGQPALPAYDATSDTQRTVRELCESHIEQSIDEIEVRKAMTPTYPYDRKRGVQSSDYHKAFNRTNVTLHPHAVIQVTGYHLGAGSLAG
jgi:cation diffusion facilitator CzcD-associated flavoprotein CzcO